MHMFMCIYFLMLHFYVFMNLFKNFFGFLSCLDNSFFQQLHIFDQREGKSTLSNCNYKKKCLLCFKLVLLGDQKKSREAAT